jgi:DNA-binding transcriptional LysR family regulator
MHDRKGGLAASMHKVQTDRPRQVRGCNALFSRGIKILKIDRTLALVSAGAGLSFIPARLRTPAVKLAQVADMEFFRTYGLLCSREREDDLNAFIKFAESHCWTV